MCTSPFIGQKQHYRVQTSLLNTYAAVSLSEMHTSGRCIYMYPHTYVHIIVYVTIVHILLLNHYRFAQGHS